MFIQEDFLGAHSDPVETIGPWAIIASVTFGAARQFRMKPVGTVHAEGPCWGFQQALAAYDVVTTSTVDRRN